MKKRFPISATLLIGMVLSGFSQGTITVAEYIDQYKEIAIEEMLEYHIPASITLAQGILESNCGNSPLAREANNHFGIKCHKEWNGRTYHQDDDAKDECFRKYATAEESYRDHSQFLLTRDRYKLLFELSTDDYKGWANGLKQAGYATNPKYPELLIRIIEENQLYRFDDINSNLAVSSQQPAAGSQQSAVSSRQSESKPQTTKHSKLHNSKNSNSKPGTQNSELTTGPPRNFATAGTGGNNRKVFENNGVKFIYATEGDDCFLVASEFGIYTWQVQQYNELSGDENLVPGQKVYLEKKKTKACFDYHKLQQGEDLRAVSQEYGIRLKSLCKRNGIIPGTLVPEGEVLLLR